jgi:hypothetical protein
MVPAFWPTAYKDVARMFVHHTRAPLDLVIHPDPTKCAIVPRAVKDEASRWRYAPSLTARVRDGSSFARVGARKRAVQVEQGN